MNRLFPFHPPSSENSWSVSHHPQDTGKGALLGGIHLVIRTFSHKHEMSVLPSSWLMVFSPPPPSLFFVKSGPCFLIMTQFPSESLPPGQVQGPSLALPLQGLSNKRWPGFACHLLKLNIPQDVYRHFLHYRKSRGFPSPSKAGLLTH